MVLIQFCLHSADFQKHASILKISVSISCVEMLCKWDENVGHTGKKFIYSIT
jgi:hypothetical protein